MKMHEIKMGYKDTKPIDLPSPLKPKTLEHGARHTDCHGEGIEFTIKVKMGQRWVPHFLSMLKYMERLGGIGGSRKVSIYADGDGDFRPQFEWDKSLSCDAEPISNYDGNNFYDAG